MNKMKLSILAGSAILFSSTLAAGISFPSQLKGFDGIATTGSFAPDSPLKKYLDTRGESCENPMVYSYSNGQAATSGLRDWMTSLGLTATEIERSGTTSFWIAQQSQLNLYGAWIAPQNGQAGRLEMCAETPSAEPLPMASNATSQRTTIRIPIWLILAGLGLVGSLGSRFGDFINSISGKQSGG